jgi:GT2 family glycosyltransferase
LTAPAVAVVVPTYERGQIVARTLAALADVEPPEGGFEVVVVDDGSSGPSAAAAGAAAATLPAARLIRQANAGPAAARNAGVAATEAPLVAFLDDDCAPAADWLVRLIAPLADEAVAAVGGRVLSAPPTNWVSRFLAAVEYASGLQPEFENAATANACYRRSVLESLGGFDEGFRFPGGDDPDLSLRARRAGHRLVFAPDAVVYHAELDSYPEFVRHMYRRGLGEARLGRKAGRERRVALRALLFPVYLARTGAICWRATAGDGGPALRLAWLGLESVGRIAFLAGSVRGLAAER